MTKAHIIKQAVAHTTGPWEHGDNGLIYGQCGEDDVEAPFVCDVIEDSAMQALGMLSPVKEANARRICAAVNARHGKPLAKLSPMAADLPPRQPGALKGKIWIADHFDGFDAELDNLFSGPIFPKE